MKGGFRGNVAVVRVSSSRICRDRGTKIKELTTSPTRSEDFKLEDDSGNCKRGWQSSKAVYGPEATFSRTDADSSSTNCFKKFQLLCKYCSWFSIRSPA